MAAVVVATTEAPEGSFPGTIFLTLLSIQVAVWKVLPMARVGAWPSMSVFFENIPNDRRHPTSLRCPHMQSRQQPFPTITGPLLIYQLDIQHIFTSCLKIKPITVASNFLGSLFTPDRRKHWTWMDRRRHSTQIQLDGPVRLTRLTGT